jgi:hypothetical protein
MNDLEQNEPNGLFVLKFFPFSVSFSPTTHFEQILN